MQVILDYISFSSQHGLHISRVVMNLRGKQPHLTLSVRPRAILESLSGTLPHTVQDSVNDTIRNTSLVNAEKLLISSMLFENSIAISADKIGGLILDNGAGVYSFSTKYSFPLVKSVTPNDFHGDILTSKVAQNLVDLLLESHHLRERCSFHVSYSKLAEEIRDLNCQMEEGGLPDLMLDNMCKALFGDDGDPGIEIYGNLKRLVELIKDRVKFLNDFVDMWVIPPSSSPLGALLTWQLTWQ